MCGDGQCVDVCTWVLHVGALGPWHRGAGGDEGYSSPREVVSAARREVAETYSAQLGLSGEVQDDHEALRPGAALGVAVCVCYALSIGTVPKHNPEPEPDRAGMGGSPTPGRPRVAPQGMAWGSPNPKANPNPNRVGSTRQGRVRVGYGYC